MAKAYANRAWMTTATSGTGTITLGSAKAGYLTFAEAGVANADTVTYVIVDGNDFEIGTGTYTSSGTTMSRDTVTASKISGTAGTTKLTLSGSAEVFLSPSSADFAFTDVANTFTQTQTITSTDAGASAGPVLDLFRNSSSPAASDIAGQLTYSGKDSAANTQTYAYMNCRIDDPTSTSEDSTLILQTIQAGAFPWGLTLNGSGTFFYHTTQRADFTFARYQNLADGDAPGSLQFAGYSDTGTYTGYGEIYCIATDSANGAEKGQFDFSLVHNGTEYTTRARINSDGQIHTFSNNAANKGVVVSRHWMMLTADYTLTNAGTEQQAFNTTTNGTLTLPTGVYEFEAFLYLTTMSATSGNLAFDPVGAGTATTDRWGYHAAGIDNSNPLNAGTRTGSAAVTQQSAASIVSAGTGTGMVVQVRGMFRVSAAGTIIPSVTLVTAAAAVMKAGSYFKVAKIGESTETYVGAWT